MSGGAVGARTSSERLSKHAAVNSAAERRAPLGRRDRYREGDRDHDARHDSKRAHSTVGFNLPDKRAQALIKRGGTRLLGVDVKGQTRDTVFRTIAEARQKGYGPDKVARLIRDQVGGGPWKSPQTRAKVIARTETKWAQNQSTIEATKASGVDYVQAVDDQIGHGDAECSARNGMVYPVSEAAGIEDHPNGTLMWVPWEGEKP